jgi:N-glycosylase/DNA lyase
VLEFEIKGSGIDFGLCVSSGQVFRWRFDGQRWVGAIGGRWFEVADESGVLSVRSNIGPEEFCRIFGLARSHEEWFSGILKADPGLSDAVESCRGLRILVQDEPVEVLFSFLCSANNHVKRIEGMVGKLASFGEDARFPDLEVLAGIDGAELRAAGFGYRAERVPACAMKVLDFGGMAWFEKLRLGESDWAVEQLQQLPGVGPKVAECVALFGLGHGDVVPIDTHVWNAVRRRYFPELVGGSLTVGRRKLVRDFMRNRFGDEAGLAHLVLFVDEMRNWRSRRV